MDNFDISLATNEERDWAAGLLSVSEPWTILGITPEQCLKNCYDPGYQVYVAHLDHKPVGVVILDPRGLAGSPYIKSITVSPEFRNRKLGAELLEYAENIARAHARHIFLCVSSFNTRARNFYENHGYHAVGELKDYLIQGESEIIMHKRL
jgi:ribosomal protein S18 acetylase RimI-like enzyme